MADKAALPPCPNCGGNVTISESYGGRGTGMTTAYAARCECGLLVDHLSDDGSSRSAVSGFKTFCRDEWPAMTPQRKDEVINKKHWKRHDYRYK